MRIGDIVENLYAGDSNPHKLGVFIGRSSVRTNRFHSTGLIVLLHADGGQSKLYARDRDHQRVVGHIDIIGALVAASRPTSVDSGAGEHISQHAK